MFCKNIWTGLYILPYGDIRTCSLINNIGEDRNPRGKDGEILNILTHDVLDIVNGTRLREMRKVNIDDPTAWHPDCSCCSVREAVTAAGGARSNNSRRVYLNQVIQSRVNESNMLEKSTDGTVNWWPNSLDIRFGNLCNQKCITCNPKFSNKWYDDWESLYGSVQLNEGRVIPITRDESGRWEKPDHLLWYEDPRWWPKFEELSQHLTHIYITGGEPMLVPAHDEMLDRLIASGRSKRLFLEYDTNATVINKKLMQRWSEFRQVDLRVSIDASGEAYELIRSGGKWPRLVENVQALKAWSVEHPNVNVHSLTSCFGTATAFLAPQTSIACDELGVNFHSRFIESPKYHCVAHWPRAAKVELLEFYERQDFPKKSVFTSYVKNVLEAPSDVTQLQTFVQTMDKLDVLRNTDWRRVLPDTARICEVYA